MTTLTAETPTLSPSNRLTNHALLNAMAALHRLNELGLRVRSLEASPTHGAVLSLDEAPPAGLLESALKRRLAMGYFILETRVAHVLGCQVEWTTRGAPLAIEARTGGVAA